MSDVLSLKKKRAPAYVINEHGAGWKHDGATQFWGYQPEQCPAEKPRGYTSRFEVPNAYAMPRNRALGGRAADRVAALVGKLTDQQVARLAQHVRYYRPDPETTVGAVQHSVILCGRRYGQLLAVEKLAKEMLKEAKNA